MIVAARTASTLPGSEQTADSLHELHRHAPGLFVAPWIAARVIEWERVQSRSMIY
jgi:hypothetical protein